jgi:hypothetical protein
MLVILNIYLEEREVLEGDYGYYDTHISSHTQRQRDITYPAAEGHPPDRQNPSPPHACAAPNCCRSM